jgi:hypothetical protein
MPNRKRRRKPVKPLIHKAPPLPTLQQAKLTAAITKLNRFLTILPVIPMTYITYDFLNMVRNAGKLLIVCLLLNLFIFGIKLPLNLQARKIGIEKYLDQGVHLLFRRYVVTLLGLSFFSNVVVLMPILYVRGYVTWLASLLPGKEQLGSNASLALAFVAGAIVSGVLGNLSYDLLKLAYKKIRE